MKPLERRQFASDNYSGVCPEAWRALEQANAGHTPAYGEDAWTERASDLLREVFEIDCEVFFTFNGTAANSLALASLCQSYHSILCGQLAHVETDECGAPEFFSNGTKVLLVPSRDGKLSPEGVEEMVLRRTDVHYPKPRVLSLTQATECGTVYSIVANSFRKKTTASPTGNPIFVPPKHNTSTPTSQVNSFAGRSRKAAALANRAPSM